MVTSAIVSSRSAEINEREGVKNRRGSGEECFFSVVVTVITKKEEDGSVAAFTMVGPWLVESEGELLVIMDERRGLMMAFFIISHTKKR